MKFLHTADLHLGYRQYNLDERLRDFERAFDRVGRIAAGQTELVDGPVDFLLIAGDLFDDRSIDARTYTHASEVLSRINEMGVHVFVIEGNHDRAYHSDGMSWLKALDHRGLIELIELKGSEEAGLRYLADYREVEVDGELARVYGVKYAGASTPRLAEDAAEEIRRVESGDPADLRILMMHFGIEDEGEGPGYGYNCLLPLREHVDYLALGHFHNAYEVDGWVHNPGSPEATSVSEATKDRGVFLYAGGEAKLLELDCREFERLFVDISEAEEPEDAYQLVADEATCRDGWVVDVTLTGDLRFDRSRLAENGVERALGGDPLHVMLKVRAERDELDVETSDMESRAQIERRVFEKLAEDGALPDGAASAMTDVKELALAGAPDEEVLRRVRDVLRGGEGSVSGVDEDVGEAEEGEGQSVETVQDTEVGDEEWNWRSAVAD